MNVRYYVILAICLSLPPMLCAQEPKIVIWRGQITLPDQQPQRARYVVQLKEEDGSATIQRVTMYLNERPFEFTELEIKPGTLNFSLDTGNSRKCELKAQDDGAFAGDCVLPGSGAKRIALTMVPPKPNE